MKSGHEKMSAVDAAWLRMDSATQRMVITAAFHFAEPLGLAEVMALLHERVLVHRRFRQRAVEPVAHGPIGPLGTPHWEEVPDLHPGDHVHELSLPDDADDAALAEVLSELASAPLDRTRPLWTLHLIHGHEAGTVLVVRLHHAIGDGVTLVQLLLALTDHAEAEPRAVGLAMPERPHGVVAFGRAVVEHGTALARMTLLPGDASTVLRGELGPKKRVAWTRTFALSALREVARAHQAKLNDVLMAATAGALRRYLEGRSGLPSVAELRAMVPVFLRGHDTEGGALGNHFGLVFLPLLIGVADPHERVRASKLANDRVKGSADAVVALEVLAAMGAAGPGVESIGIDIFTRKASCMITNVPGPTTALRLAGRPVANLIVWAPVAGHIGTGISLVTYDGKVRVGVCSDARLVPDPDRIARAWEAEVELLVGGLAQS